MRERLVQVIDLETNNQALTRFRDIRGEHSGLSYSLFSGSDVRHTQAVLASADPRVDQALDKLDQLQRVISMGPRQARGLMILNRFVLPWKARSIQNPYTFYAWG